MGKKSHYMFGIFVVNDFVFYDDLSVNDYL